MSQLRENMVTDINRQCPSSYVLYIVLRMLLVVGQNQASLAADGAYTNVIETFQSTFLPIV